MTKLPFYMNSNKYTISLKWWYVLYLRIFKYRQIKKNWEELKNSGLDKPLIINKDENKT